MGDHDGKPRRWLEHGAVLGRAGTYWAGANKWDLDNTVRYVFVFVGRLERSHSKARMIEAVIVPASRLSQPSKVPAPVLNVETSENAVLQASAVVFGLVRAS